MNNKVFITFFILIIFSIPIIGSFEDITKKENFLFKKIITSEQIKNSQSLKKTFKNTQKYLEDRVGLNTELIGGRGYLLYKLGMTGKPDLHIDSSGKLYKLDIDYISKKNFDLSKSIFDYNTIININKIKEISKQHGIEFYFAIAPMRVISHFNKIPSPIVNKMRSLKKNFELGESYLNSSSDHMIYMGSVFDNIDNVGDYFFKLDNHWNDVGVYKGYQLLMNKVLKKESNTYKKDLSKIPGSKVQTSLARYMGIQEYVSEKDIFVSHDIVGEIKEDHTYFKHLTLNQGEHPKRITKGNGEKKVLLYHDSMGESFAKYLGSDFKEVLMVNPWKDTIRTHWNNCYFNPEILLKEKPDIFIIQLIPTRLFENTLGCEKFL